MADSGNKTLACRNFWKAGSDEVPSVVPNQIIPGNTLLIQLRTFYSKIAQKRGLVFRFLWYRCTGVVWFWPGSSAPKVSPHQCYFTQVGFWRWVKKKSWDIWLVLIYLTSVLNFSCIFLLISFACSNCWATWQCCWWGLSFTISVFRDYVIYWYNAGHEWLLMNLF